VDFLNQSRIKNPDKKSDSIPSSIRNLTPTLPKKIRLCNPAYKCSLGSNSRGVLAKHQKRQQEAHVDVPIVSGGATGNEVIAVMLKNTLKAILNSP